MAPVQTCMHGTDSLDLLDIKCAIAVPCLTLCASRGHAEWV